MAKESRIVFMGTSPFAAVILECLCHAGYRPLAVYTQPDRPAGRGMTLRPSAVKTLAADLGLSVLQPVNFRGQSECQQLADFEPDFLIVAAYGLILPQTVLDVPAIAPINVHGSLLPSYRGAAPIQRAIMDNWHPDARSGVSIMKMTRGMDEGPVYATASVALADHTSASLTQVLARLGGELLVQCLPEIASGKLQPVPQNNAEATYAAKLTKADGVIDWHRPAQAVAAQIRGVTPWPGAASILEIGGHTVPITVLKGEVGQGADEQPGTVIMDKNGLHVACADAFYHILQLKPQGRQPMASKAFLNGLRLAPDSRGMMV